MVKPLRILILEDVASDAALVERELLHAGLQFVSRCVDTEPQFVAALDEFKPDVILSDYTLPSFNGMAALRVAGERAPAVPAIIVTGSLSEEIAVECIKAGAADYVLKDRLARLPVAVRGAIERRRLAEDQRRAEEALRRQFSILQGIIESSGSPIFSVDRGLRYTSFNRAHRAVMKALYGTEIELGRSILECQTEPEDRETAGRNLTRALAGETFTEKAYSGDEARTRALFEVVHTPIHDDSGAVIGVSVFVWDVTDRTRAEEALREAKEHLEIRVQERTVELEQVNRALQAEIAERKRAEEALQEAHHELEQRVAERTEELRRANEGLRTEITERKQAEEGLRLSEERFRAITESANEAIVVANAKGRFVVWHKGAERLFGYTPEEALGQPVSILIPEPYLTRHRQAVVRLQKTGVPSVSGTAYEGRGLRKDGTEVPVEISLARWSTGKETMYGAIIRDIGERKKLEEQLRQSQKMEAVGQLAGGVAHDFNNLLQALLSLTQILVVHKSDAERVAADAAELEQQVKRGAALTRQLLLFSRRETVRPERLDLNEIVSESVKLLRRLLRENVTIQTCLADRTLPVDADRGQLGQVLVNLAVNAADAMPEGGRLAIETGSSNGTVWLKVADTGGGIPVAIHDHIFEPFFTTKGQGKGTGLGLSVVHGIVIKHGGTVTFESREGEGTTFAVTLPRAGSGERLAVGVADLGGESPRGNGERVLVVEDEDAARQALSDILTELGYTVTAVGSGEEAGALAAEPPFDVLLTDLILPGISGGELAIGLQARWPELRVVLMSGYTEDEAVRLGAQAGVVRFLQKPFDMATLAREARAALATKVASTGPCRAPTAGPAIEEG